MLRGTRVRKYHEVTFYPGSTLFVLVSPEGEAYFRITRDADLVTDVPAIPDDWQLVEYVATSTLRIALFEGDLVISTDNEDSFQGPVPEFAELL